MQLHSFLRGFCKRAADAAGQVGVSLTPPTPALTPQTSSITSKGGVPTGLNLDRAGQASNRYVVNGMNSNLPFGNRDSATGHPFLKKYDQNSLLINAHGVDGQQFKSDRSMGETVRPDILQGVRGEPWAGAGFEDIAKSIGPATNKVHNLYSAACNYNSGCTPQEAQKWFPNLTNQVMLPPGKNNFLMDVSKPAYTNLSALLTSAMGTASATPSFARQIKPVLESSPDFTPIFKEFPGIIGRDTAPPQMYRRQGTNWVNQGAYTPSMTPNSLTNSFYNNVAEGSQGWNRYTNRFGQLLTTIKNQKEPVPVPVPTD